MPTPAAQDLIKRVEAQNLEQTAAKSVTTPGKIQLGGMVGATSDAQPIVNQALTTVNRPNPWQGVDIPKAENKNILSGTEAAAYQKSIMGSVEKDRQALADRQQAAAEANAQAEKDMQARLNSTDIAARAGATFEAMKAKQLAENAPQREKMATGERSQELSQNAIGVLQGTAGSPMGEAATAKLTREHQMQQDEFNRQEQEQLNRLWDSALSGTVGSIARAQKDLYDVREAREKSNENFAKQQKDVLELQKADTQQGGAIYSAVQAGHELTETQLEANDSMKGYKPGTSAVIFAAEKAIYQREQNKKDREAYASELNIQKAIEDLADRPMEREAKMLDIQAKLQASKDAMYTTLSKIQDAVNGALPGQVIPIGNAEYFGLPGIQHGVIEKDQNGVGTIGGFDSKGKWQQQSLGYIGDPSDLETVFINGISQIVNRRTGKNVPITNGVGGAPLDTGWSKLAPCGSEGGQCGSFIHQFVEDYPYGINTVEARRGIANVPKGEMPRVGDVLLQDYGTTGHSAMVSMVYDSPEGKRVRLTESNFNGDELVTDDRTVSIDDPSILGYFRGQLRPHAQTGSGMPAVAGPKKPVFQPVQPSFSAEAKGKEVNPFITPGVKMTAAQMQEADQKFQAAKRGRDILLKGGSPSDIEQNIKTAAMDMAFKEGWKPQAETSSEVWGQALLDGSPLVNVPMAERTKALEFAQKNGYKAAGNANFQKMSDSAKTEFVDLFGLGSLIDSVKTMKMSGDTSIFGTPGQPQDTGPLAAATNAFRGWFNIANPNLLDLRTITEDLRSGIFKERSGAAVSEKEVKRLTQFLPTISDNDQVFESKINGLEKKYNEILENKAKLYGFKDLAEFKRQFGIGEDTSGLASSGLTVITSPTGVKLQYDLNNPAEKAEYEQAKAAGWK